MSDSQELIGSQISDYRLKNRLGRGTFGTVYLSENMHDQSLAAVKVLNIHLSSKDDLGKKCFFQSTTSPTLIPSQRLNR
jgi:serine/threonine protein kinase